MSRLISALEVANLIGVSRQTVYRLANAGVLPPSVRFGRRVRRWRESSIRDHIRKQEKAEREVLAEAVA